MQPSRWRLPAAGATVIVGAVTGVLINLITARWSIALGVGLGVLLVIGVLLQVMLAAADDGSGSDDSGSAHPRRGIWQKARARGHATIIQAGRDVVVSPQGMPAADEQDPGG